MPAVTTSPIAIIGGGPAGLMAAEQLTRAGYRVDLYDAMPSVGRKFLLAGIGGLNITHSEPFPAFCSRYAGQAGHLQPLLAEFGAEALRAWCSGLGVETFIGTSGRVFPNAMKAAPLLRAWLSRLRQQGLHIHPRHRWQGWDAEGRLLFTHAGGTVCSTYAATVLALGGGSWRKLGSDGAWVDLLAAEGIAIAPLRPANCGFLCNWSGHLQKHAGAPLKSVALSFTTVNGQHETRLGELILTAQGVEGSLIYAFAARLRDQVEASGSATFHLDLCPHQTHAQLEQVLASKPHSKTLGSFLKSRLHLDAAKTALVFEALHQTAPGGSLAHLLKALPITVIATTPLDEAISTAGGVAFAALDQHLMLKQKPGVFCAGEMLDWEAPTGGYLLTACFATGRQAGLGVIDYLSKLHLSNLSNTEASIKGQP